MKKIIAIILLIGIGYSIAYYSSSKTITIKVNDKERIVETTGGENPSVSSKYLVYTEQGVFENTDNLMFLKFNSSDVYNSLKRDSTYNVTVAGWRIPLFSMYQNVIRINK